MVAQPTLVNPISDLEVITNAENTIFDLFNNFDDPFTTGLVASFQLFDDSFPNEGVTEVLLFDQAGEGTPLTVENFTNYVEDGDYENSIIHRSVEDFVIQGGGFIVEGVAEALAANDPPSAVSDVPTDDPIPNEFSPERSNVQGTIAMAKLGNDPDSATSQWFFNLGDNSANLDDQNGGFTVFGEVLSDEDFEVVEAIAQVPVFDDDGINEQTGESQQSLFGRSAFGQLPLKLDQDNPTLTGDDDFVRYESISVSQVPELTFAITNNSNPELVEATITNGELVLDYLDNQAGTASITVQATNLVGETVEDTFSVVVEEPAVILPEANNDNLSIDQGNVTTIDFLDNDTFAEGLSDIAIATNPENGGIEIDDNDTPDDLTDDTFTYTPNEGFSGNDSFSYTLTDSEGNTSTASVNITVNPTSDSALLFGSEGNDEIAFSSTNNSGLIFSGAGDDTIDTQNAQAGSRRLYGGEGNDRLTVSRSDRAFGGSGDDTLDGSFGNGNNRLYGGEGEDDFILGSNDRAIGGDGDDIFTLTSGGDNLLSGGNGNDEFRLEADNLPESLNLISDFTSGNDQITFAGFTDLDFTNVSLTGDNGDTLIGLDNIDNDFLRLQGVAVDTLSEADFNFVL